MIVILELIFWSRVFWGLNDSPRDFFELWFLPPFVVIPVSWNHDYHHAPWVHVQYILLYSSRAYRATCTVTSAYSIIENSFMYVPLTLQVLLLKTSILTGFSALDFKISFNVSLSWSCKICNNSFHVGFFLNIMMHTHCMKIQSKLCSRRKTFCVNFFQSTLYNKVKHSLSSSIS